METAILDSIRSEYERYRGLAEATIRQLADDELCAAPGGAGNSVATIVWHISGNLESRFTDFLTSDGEKSWRDREGEFLRRTADRSAILGKWRRGWDTLSDALDELADADLSRTVRIRGQELRVSAALHRSLAHTAYHVGQIVDRGKVLRGDDWEYLSIVPGDTAAYHRDPDIEKGSDRAGAHRTDNRRGSDPAP